MNHSSPYVYQSEPKFYIDVPCGHCFSCLKKRSQNWFLRAKHIRDKLNLRPEQIYFCTFTVKPELYKDFCDEPYAFIRKFLDRLRKHPKFKYYGLRGGVKYRPVKFPYIFVAEYADGTRAKQRGLTSQHRLHLHAIFFAPPFTYREIVNVWQQHYGIADVSGLNPQKGLAGVRYVINYCFNDDKKRHRRTSKWDGKIWVSHGFGYLDKNDVKAFRQQMTENACNWFIMYVNNFRYSIPRYWKNKCFTKTERECIQNEFMDEVFYDIAQSMYPMSDRTSNECRRYFFEDCLSNYYGLKWYHKILEKWV